MPHFLQQSESRRFRLTLNTDGHRHPVQNTLAVGTLVCGLVAFVSLFFPLGHVVASWVGTLGIVVGFWSQYISATTPQRSLNVVGLVGSFIGVALGLAGGGFLP